MDAIPTMSNAVATIVLAVIEVPILQMHIHLFFEEYGERDAAPR